MANSASLLRYAALPGLGWRRGTLVQAKNGRVKPNALLYGGVEYTVEPDNGVFQIRHYENGKNAYTNCGTDVEQALARLAQLQAKATLLTAQRKLGMTNERTQQLLTDLLSPFIEKYAHGSEDTVYAYRYTATSFVNLMTRRGTLIPANINEDSVIAFDRWLEAQGNKKNTRATRYGYIRCFLRYCGLDPNKLISPEEHKKLKAKPKLAVETYSEDELLKLYSSSSERHRLVWRTYRELGLREEELCFAFWCDVDFDHAVWKVRFKPKATFWWNRELAWKSKDSEERDIPIPVGLLKELAALKKNADSTTPLVFPTRGGQTDIKLLKALKSDWRDAGLNCGHCAGCLGKRNECSRAKIKTFRSTYLTTMSEHVSLPSVQALAGHSDIKTTMRYLKPAAMDTLQKACNKAFGATA
jgi:integrase